MKRAFITGVTGQDGRYLSALLLSKGYRVWGLVRRSSQPREIPDGIEVVEGDITDALCISKAIKTVAPSEVYNLAAQTHVGRSFTEPEHTFRANALGALNVIEAASDAGSRVYQASTSEMFGNTGGLLNEESPMRPVSPYGIAKLAAHNLISLARVKGNYAVSGILFNHESPLRGDDFVTQKIAKGAASGARITLGNLNAQRDWGHAKDYVRAMWMMLQQDIPADYVIATGKARSVRDILITTIGDDYMEFVDIDSKFMRPNEIHYLAGDSSKARRELGWEPTIKFDAMMDEMVAAAMETGQ